MHVENQNAHHPQYYTYMVEFCQCLKAEKEREREKTIINELIVFSTEITKNNVHTFLGVFNK